MSSLILNEILNLTKAKKVGSGWMGHCPTHDDKNPSLSINNFKDDPSKAVIYCHVCGSEEPYKYFTENTNNSSNYHNKSYIYNSAKTGLASLRVVRSEDRSSMKKIFYQQHLVNGSWCKGGVKEKLQPYMYDKWKDKKLVFLVEGEKCVHCLEAIGLNASTTPGGSNGWKSYFAEFFRDKEVYLLPDKDDCGEKYMKNAGKDLTTIAQKVTKVDLPGLKEGEDVYDWLSKGGNREELLKICEASNKVEVDVDPIPLPLFRKPERASDYPIELLGNHLGAVVKALSDSIGSPLAIAAQSVLGAVSLAVQGHYNVEIDGRVYPTSLYLMTIAMSGERKSANDKIALKAHFEYQKKLHHEYKTQLTSYNNQFAFYEESRKKVLKQAKDKNTLESNLTALGAYPKKPLTSQYITSEPTYEGLVKNLEHGQPSMGLFSDEGGRLIGGHAFNSDNLLKTVSGFSELWDMKAINRTRAGDGSSVIYGKRLSMHLMIQPVVANILLGNKILSQQGFINRCLITWPESNIGKRKYKSQSIEESSEVQSYLERCSEILNLDKPLKDNTQNELEPRNLRLSEEAKKVWIEFYDQIEKNLGDDGSYVDVSGYGSKIPEQALRIAGCITAFEGKSETISLQVMYDSLLLAEYYLQEYQRIFQSPFMDSDLSDAQILLDWLLKNKDKQYYLSYIYQYGPKNFRNKQKTKKSFKILEAHGWVKKLNEGIVIDGSKRKEAWEVYNEQ